MERRTSVHRGLLLGGLLAVLAVTSDAMWVLANRAADAPQSTPAQRIWLALTLTILGTAVVVGCVAALRSQSRRFGLGLLLGLVVSFPILWLLVAFFMWGGQ